MDGAPPFNAIKERWRSLAREQKISAGILAVCGVIALGLSVEHLGASIRDPFTVSREKITSAVEELNKLDPATREDAEAKRRDTDGDGLSDYDELHRFQTSPYLADTDGDGKLDNVELALGANPNCAQGQVCAAGLIDVSGLSTSTPFITSGATAGNPADSFYAAFQRGVNTGKAQVVSESGSTSTDFEQGLVRDPVEIRKALLDSGKISAAQLDQITDAQLLQLYDQATIQAAQQKVQEETGITDPKDYPTPDFGDTP
ncbi:MAG: hypothetical protein ABIO72_03715 [Patescibacteria group bacterium]